MAGSHVPVLIIGAGPSGLVLALWLTKIGVKCRIIDKTAEPGTTSRALVVHSRTLEFYRQLGIADEVINRGFQFPRINLWVKHQKRASIFFGDIGQELTPFPFVTIFPQDQHEKLLIELLEKLGVRVERRTELIDFKDDSEAIRARIRLPSGQEEECLAEYVAGCDGAHSKVREILGVGFSGSAYPGMFYVADVQGEGPVFDKELHFSLEQAEFLAVFPLKEKGCARLIGIVHEKPNREAIHWEDVNQRIFKEFDIKIDKVNWFSTYHVHHRVASSFKKGRVFLLGDAGHIHSPVGGQGMNTGIGDAVNLAWKLSDVINGRADSDLLNTYNTERIGFARTLVSTVDRVFTFVTAKGALARFVRLNIVPYVLPVMTPLKEVQRAMFRLVSQTGISYRKSLKGQSHSGGIQAGDRLPWIESVDNFAPLKSLAWQIHVYGSERAVQETGFPVHHFSWNQEMKRKGLIENAIYHIRPDGYVAEIER